MLPGSASILPTNFNPQTHGSSMKANKLMGIRLQMAFLLVAEGALTDQQIAIALRIKSRTLEEAKERPYFSRRVGTMQVARKHGKSRLHWRGRSKDVPRNCLPMLSPSTTPLHDST